jgi:hypothetical protein
MNHKPPPVQFRNHYQYLQVIFDKNPESGHQQPKNFSKKAVHLIINTIHPKKQKQKIT